MELQQRQQKRIVGFDGMRGLAALLIVAFHVAILGAHTGHNEWFDRTIGRGDCLVRMFFMLSSFSLMCGYHAKFMDGTFDIRSYLRRRAARIFPCFWVVMVLHFALNISIGNSNSPAELIGTGSMIFALLPSQQDSMVWGGMEYGYTNGVLPHVSGLPCFLQD